MESFEDDDIVVEEIPVFLSKNLQENLYLFQYPTKTQINNLDKAAVINCCVKPINKEVKVDFELNTESHFYDRFKGENFAHAADGKLNSKNERPTYKRGIMDKQSFISTHSVENVNKYVIGIYSDKEIHLSPLSSILQLRPAFSYFDKEDKRTKAEQRALNDEDDEKLQQVTVKFSRTGAASNKKLKDKQGYDSFLKKSNEESWCETYWHPRTSPTAELERQKLFTTNHQWNHSLSLSSNRYIEKLLPNVGQNQGIDAVLPARIISKARLKPMTLNEQLKILLKDAKMLSFGEIISILQQYIDPKIGEEKVLRTLPQIALCIHGNWVLQSDVLYPTDSVSNCNGVTSESMVRARDYILFRFSRSQFLHRPQVIFATQLPPEEASEVLESVAKLNGEKQWELLLPPDKEFLHKHPDIIQRQEMLWRVNEQAYNEISFEKSPKRVRKRSTRDSKSHSQSESTVNTV